jgi:hypothetical protein|tara:strand:- start:3433 stop:3660 length:228 start_codon:yes stop_codon:yes gene_type:complete
MVENLEWLGEDQRLFLERGYLKQGVTAEERYNKIADTIQSFCNTNKIVTSNLKNINLEFNYSTKGIGDRFRQYTQ